MSYPLPLDDDDQIDEFYIQTLLLSKVIRRILKNKADIELSRKPVFIYKPITEFKKRMRVTGIDKFEERTYISTINFYENEENLKKHKALAALIIYIGESYIVELLSRLNYPDIDEDEIEELEDACGTLCNLIAGNFKTGLTQLGYVELMMSHFSGYQNDVLNGVEFSQDQSHMYEIQFEVKGVKRIVAELSMGSVPMIERS